MLFITVLVLSLAILAGIIAYAGDMLGTYIGKKRLSLFGWRPKRTGRVIGISAGILIMLVTIGSLSIAFRGAVTTLVNFQETSQELRIAQQEQQRLQAANLQLETTNASLSESNEFLAARNADLANQNTSLSTENVSLSTVNEVLTARNADLQNSLLNLTQRTLNLEAQLAGLLREQEMMASEIANLQSIAEDPSGGSAIFRENEPIVQRVISARDPTDISRELATLIQDAQNEVLTRDVRPSGLSAEQFRRLQEEVAATPGDDIVEVYSKKNHINPNEEVELSIGSQENLQILKKGQLVASRQIHLGSADIPISREEIREQLVRLSGDAGNQLRRLGLFATANPTDNTTAARLDSFANQIRRLKGPIVVGLVVTDATFKSGPVSLEPIIIR